MERSDHEGKGRTDLRKRIAPDDENDVVIQQERVKLKKSVGLISGTSFIVGTIIGSGIFVSPKGVLSETGSVGLSLIIWGAGGILSLLGSLSYAELGTLITKSGGEYSYLYESMGKIMAYLFAWTKIIILTPSVVAICTQIFADYFTTFFLHCGPTQLPTKLVAALIIVTLCIINCLDTKLAASVQVFFTAAKLIALVIIIIGGFVWLGQGHLSTMQQGFFGTTSSPSSIALAFYDALWAYEGWNSLNYVTEELRNPCKNLPRANILGILLVTVIYVLANVSYLTVLGTDGLLDSNTVAVTWAEKVLGSVGVIMPIFVMCSTFGAANGALFAGVRTLYAAARDRQFPEILSYVHCKYYTPMPCIIFTTLLSLLMLIPGDVGSLIDFFSFAAWLFYALTIVSLLILRWTKRDAHRPIKVYILLPITFLVCSVYLVVAPIVQDPRIEFLYAFLFIVGGLVFYFPLVHFRLHRGCFNPVTKFFQLWMEVVPSPYEPEVQ